MFRKSPPYLLSQGDLLVIPSAEVEVDPSLLTLDKVPGQVQPPCSKCGHQPPPSKPGKEWVRSGVSARLRKGEAVFTRGKEKVISAAETIVGLLLTHSCDVDDGDFLTFATVWPLDRCSSPVQARVKSKRPPIHLFHIAESDWMPEAVANLELQVSLSVKHFGTKMRFVSKRTDKLEPALVPFSEAIEARLNSLDEATLEVLYKRLFEHIARPAELDFGRVGAGSAFDDDPERPKTLGTKGWWWPKPKWLSKPLAPTPAAPPASGQSVLPGILEPQPKDPSASGG
ncbi:MAG: hypothetical protein ACYC8T_32090 [Myxococcaceae bacterium]